MGCYEVGLGDTLGVGTSFDVEKLLKVLLPEISADRLAGHYHDTYGQAVAMIVKSYEMGLRAFDSSVAGLGGCPYAKGATGNVATEDVVYMFDKAGVSTGVDLQQLSEVRLLADEYPFSTLCTRLVPPPAPLFVSVSFVNMRHLLTPLLCRLATG